MMEALMYVLLIVAIIIGITVVTPVITASLKIHQLRKAGRNQAGIRTVDEIIDEINFHDMRLHVCRAEFMQLIEMNIANNTPENLTVKEEPVAVKITYNSDEIGCRYQGLDIPKYIRNEEGNWFEFESLALFDIDNKAIVDHVELNYITIFEKSINSGFFYRQMDKAPILKDEIVDGGIETV